MSTNEGKACDAVLRLLERRSCEPRADLRFPDRDRVGPPVELRARLGAQEYAIEHTRIEPFPGQIRTGKQFSQLVAPVQEAVSGTLPGPAYYELLFPLDPSLNEPSHRLVEHVETLVHWVRKEAGPLYMRSRAALASERSPRYFRESTTGTPPGFPYPVTLCCSLGIAPAGHRWGGLSCARIAPGDDRLECLRAKRLRQALCDKCPKLDRCRDEGARTVLVLESDDIALTDQSSVRALLPDLLAKRSDVPDEIYLVVTQVDSWLVYPMKVGDEVLFSEEVPIFDVFEKKDLVDLTSAL